MCSSDLDFATKTRKVEAFLGDGSKVKVTIMFRGREMPHPQLGRRILDKVAEAVAHVGRVEVFPKLEGRNMSMVLVPGQATRRQREAAAEYQEVPEPDATTEEATTEIYTLSLHDALPISTRLIHRSAGSWTTGSSNTNSPSGPRKIGRAHV